MNWTEPACGLIEVQFKHSPSGAEETHEKTHGLTAEIWTAYLPVERSIHINSVSVIIFTREMWWDWWLDVIPSIFPGK
jgi:hypothetical protein